MFTLSSRSTFNDASPSADAPELTDQYIRLSIPKIIG
jgi:hypothetical protein